MTEPHRIRLRGPWIVAAEQRTRRFGKPRLVSPSERVWLVIDQPSVDLAVELNGIKLSPTDSPVRVDITSLLLDRNELVLRNAEQIHEVVMEIACVSPTA